MPRLQPQQPQPLPQVQPQQAHLPAQLGQTLRKVSAVRQRLQERSHAHQQQHHHLEHEQQAALLADARQQQQQRQRLQRQAERPQPATEQPGHEQQQAQHAQQAPTGLPALQLQQQLPRGQRFSTQLGLCELCARSDSLAEWRCAVLQVRQLVPLVCSPLQAQQLWAVSLSLAHRPLPKRMARELSGAVAALVKLTLANHDHGVLQALAGYGRGLPFSFSARQLGALVGAAADADVELETLHGLLGLAPPGGISAGGLFRLVSTFIGRGQTTEAANVLAAQQGLEPGRRMSPAMARLQEQLASRVRNNSSGQGGGSGQAGS